MAEKSTNKSRDIILLIAAGLLIALALLPEGERSSDSAKTDDGAFDDLAGGGESGEEGDDGASASSFGTPGTRAAEPLPSIPHEYLPLVPGSAWVYRVRGPEKFVPDETWTLRLLSAPRGEEPGEVEVGFGTKLARAKIWHDSDVLRFGGLPLVEPVEFIGNRPTDVAGEFLPIAERILQGAVWTQDSERDVMYTYRDKRGKVHRVEAHAKQRDRALVEDFENITLPVGMYRACRVFWLSRIEIKAKGRPVLQDLTSEPFRREKMWIVSGIGIVRRRVEYPGYRAAQIAFDLVSYDRPEVIEEKK